MKEAILYPDKKYAFRLEGTIDELDEAVYLFEDIFKYIKNRAAYGWTQKEINESMEMLADRVRDHSGQAKEIIEKQDEYFTIDAVNKNYKKVLRGRGDIRYSVDEYLYNDEFYDVADRPIVFWTNTIKERELVKMRLSDFQKKMTKDLRSLSFMDEEFIKNPLLTGDEIISYLDTTEEILDLHKTNE